MSEKLTVGSAFPVNTSNVINPGGYGADPGMSIRDYFAAQAIVGLLASQETGRTMEIINGLVGGRLLAEAAYLISDAMLKERDK